MQQWGGGGEDGGTHWTEWRSPRSGLRVGVWKGVQEQGGAVWGKGSGLGSYGFEVSGVSPGLAGLEIVGGSEQETESGILSSPREFEVTGGSR